MKWFKFYGQDWLTDLKVMQMSMEDRLCYITLMCLASSSEENGVIRNCTEESIIMLSRIPDWVTEDNNPFERAKGCFGRFIQKGMITNDNADNVTVVNFMKRQDTNLSNYERVKRYREKQRIARNKGLLNDNADNVINDNDRVDKNRIDNINTPASHELLKTNKKTMKNSFKYNENAHTDTFEDVIDSDTGQVAKAVPKTSTSKVFKEITDWASKRRGSAFVNLPKQYKALSSMKNAGITPNDIMNRWSEMETDS